MSTQIRWGLVLALLGSPAFCQITTINLGTQGRNFDFSNAAFTRPATVGTGLPATCTVGQMYFNVSAPAGQNLYGCSVTNVWSAVGTSSSSGSVVQTVSGIGPVNGNVSLASTNLTDGTNIDRQATVATLPLASSSMGNLYWVTNGGSQSDCSVGGGTYAVPCISNGSNWVAATIGSGLSTAIQTNQTGTQSLSGPLLAPQLNNIFYVSGYKASGTHTDYDMARQAADAFATTNPGVGAVLMLKPGVNMTCDSAPLPVGTAQPGTTSIIGWGSGISFIRKQTGCTAAQATFYHPATPGGFLNRGWYQGFTVDANHIDTHACDTYGMGITTFLDISCGNAVSDHEWEFGSGTDSKGWMDNIYGYNLHTFDNVGVGKGANLSLQWSNGQLTGATINDGGTQHNYTDLWSKITFIGPDVATCTVMPQATLTVSHANQITFANLPSNWYGLITGMTVTNPGQCASTARIYPLIQDGYIDTITYGFKFTNMADSYFWNIEAWGDSYYGEWFNNIASDISLYGEHPFTNQTIQIGDFGSQNTHVAAQFDSPGQYGVYLGGSNGSFVGARFEWDGPAYFGASAYYIGNGVAPANGYGPAYVGVPTNWHISGSNCATNGYQAANPYFQAFTNAAGPISATNPIPSGVWPQDVEVCDGSHRVFNSMGSQNTTSDGVNFTFPTGSGVWFQSGAAGAERLSSTPNLGIHPDFTNNALLLRNDVTGTADPDPFGIDGNGTPFISNYVTGSLIAKQMSAPAGPTLTVANGGNANATYACTATDALGNETNLGTPATISTAPATLSSTTYVSITCPFVPGLHTVKVYRLTNDQGLSQGQIGVVTKVSWERGSVVKDSGQTAGAAAPSVNNTGYLGVAPSSGSNYIALGGNPTGQRMLTLPDANGSLPFYSSVGTSGNLVKWGGNGSLVDGGSIPIPATLCIACVQLAGQTAAISNTTAFTATVSGTYHIGAEAYMTTASTSTGTLKLNITYGTNIFVGTTCAMNSLGTACDFSRDVHLKAGQSVVYSTQFTVTPDGSPVYGVDVTLTRVQ